MAAVTLRAPQAIQGMPGGEELLEQFAADTVTAGSDGGGEHGFEVLGSAPKFVAQGFHPGADDSRSGAAPARVQDGSGTLNWIEQRDRHAVG
jgi:hypothetical protein